MARGDLQTPFSDAVAPTPAGSPSGSGDTTGGFDFPDGRKESANMSGLPAQVTTIGLQGDDPGPNGQVAMPPVDSPGTIKTSGAPE